VTNEDEVKITGLEKNKGREKNRKLIFILPCYFFPFVCQRSDKRRAKKGEKKSQTPPGGGPIFSIALFDQ